MSYGEEDTCTHVSSMDCVQPSVVELSYVIWGGGYLNMVRGDFSIMSYGEEDTCMSYGEEDT